MSLLDVDRLTVSRRDAAHRHIVDGLSFALEAGGSLALVGESGSGKTQSALALLGLQASTLQASGSVRFAGRELMGADEAMLRSLRGAQIGFVFQDPMSSLNPYLDVGTQIAEVLECHRGATRAAALEEARRLLDAVRIADAARRLTQYPHELSGGMRQRVMIAIAIACRPALLIADEPTTALDVTVQQQLVLLLAELRREFGLALLLITHDLDLVAELCAQTLVMYAGRAMEFGSTAALLRTPQHPYTHALLQARPRLDTDPRQPLYAIPGTPPRAADAVRGCRFAPRCASAQELCREREPPYEHTAEGARRCHLDVAEIAISVTGVAALRS